MTAELMTFEQALTAFKKFNCDSFLDECRKLGIKAQRCVARKCLIANWFKLMTGITTCVTPKTSYKGWEIYQHLPGILLSNDRIKSLPKWAGDLAAKFDEQEDQLKEFVAQTAEEMYPQ